MTSANITLFRLAADLQSNVFHKLILLLSKFLSIKNPSPPSRPSRDNFSAAERRKESSPRCQPWEHNELAHKLRSSERKIVARSCRSLNELKHQNPQIALWAITARCSAAFPISRDVFI
jgi:hypothetical protein